MSSYRSALVKLLAFAFVTLLVTGFLVRTVQGHQDSHAATYTAVFGDATKLKKGDDVRLAGVSVGRVTSISLGDDAHAHVRFSLDHDVRLTDASSATIRYRNLVGDRYVALDVPAGGAGLPPGSTIPLARTHPALDLTSVFNGFKPLFQGLDASSINALSLSLVQALQGEGGTLASLLSSTGSLGSAISARDATIGTLVTDLTQVLSTLNENSAPFNRLITHLRDFTTGLDEDKTTVLDALAGIDRLARATDTLLTEARPSLKTTITGTRALATRLEEHSDKLAEKIQLLPVKLNGLMRAAQYGSWFQFYNCGMGAEIDLGGNTPPLAVPPSGPTTGICGG